MIINGTVASAIFTAIAVIMMTSRGYARLGEDPRIDELIVGADVICAGSIVGFEAVKAAGEQVGTNSIWFALRFAVDHKIKSLIQTNELLIVMQPIEDPEKVKDILDRAQPDEQKRKCRFLVFLKAMDIKRSQFKFVKGQDGMVQVSSRIPSVGGDAGIEKLIEDEMTRRLKELGPANQTQIKTMLEKWQREAVRAK